MKNHELLVERIVHLLIGSFGYGVLVKVPTDLMNLVLLYVFLAGGALNTQWNSTQPSPASYPERDRAQKGQDPWFWGLRDCLQGKTHKNTIIVTACVSVGALPNKLM